MYPSKTFELITPTPLSFTPSGEQVIYIEREYDEETNRYIDENYYYIRDIFHRHRIDFCYLPFRAEDYSRDLLLHHNPNLDKDGVDTVDFSTKEFVDVLFGGKVPDDLQPSLILYRKDRSTPESACFFAVEFQKERPQKVFEDKRPRWKKVLGIAKPVPPTWRSVYDDMAYELACSRKISDANNDAVFYSEVNWYDDAYWAYMEEHGELLAEIDLKIHQLQERGVDSLILKKMLCAFVDENRPLSRLVITEDLRIILPDYHDMEIRIEPINKALYLLFLRHEEGLRIKELSTYRNELEALYTRLSHDEIGKRQASLDKLLDPTDNSINEKLSRIRQAFIAHFEEDLAENYFVTGNRGETKGIRLDRSLVEWQ